MSNFHETTVKLVGDAQGGNSDARELLFQRYLPRVARIVASKLRMNRDALPDTIDDITQETLIRALNGLARFEMHSPGAFMAWMSRITENCIRSHLRSWSSPSHKQLWQKYGDINLTESLLLGNDPTISTIVNQAESNQLLENALLSLPSHYREAISLRAFAEMSHAEIAQEMGRTEVSCRKLVQRGMELLRVHIDKHSDSRDGG
jgi:RNA polymerase sigma factor (sigma-70 family)